MGDASGDPGSSRDAMLGKLALERHWVTPLQLRDALSEQWSDVETGRGQTRPLGAILVSRGILTPAQLDELLEQVRLSVPAFPPFGKYHLVREIGRGAMGVVYEARDTESGRRVALKMLIAAPAQDPAEEAPEHDRFLREGQLHRNLPPHPGIVPVLEADYIEGRRYLAMELVDGVSMDAWVKQGSVTLRQRIALLRTVALAVHHAHRHGIVHRDLKPENVLVDRNHQPRITDFGLAKIVGPAAPPLATATGTALGTPAYMSPEQVKGAKDVDHRADIYALGVMLYEILTGRRPFAGDTPYEIMMKTVNEPVVPPSKVTHLQINPVLYRNIENICLIALAKDPRDRYGDAEAFARDLTKWLQGDDLRVVVPRSWRILRSRKLLPLAAAGLVLAGLAGAGSYYLRSREGASAAVRSVPVRSPAGNLQPGCIAEYYAGMNFNALGLRRIDSRARFDDPAVPLWKDGPGIYTSRRWIGFLRVPATGNYVLEIFAQERARLLIDDVEIYAGIGPETRMLPLRQGDRKFVLEHAHFGAEDTVSISWKKAGEDLPVKLGPGGLYHSPRDFQPVQPQPLGRTKLGPVPGAEEGEGLVILQDSGRRPTRKPYGPYSAFWQGSWSGTDHLFWPAAKVGDKLRVRFASGETGRSTLVLGLTQASDHAVYKVSVNNAVVAPALDLFSDALLTREFEFKDVALLAGGNELEFEVIGSNPAAKEWSPGNGVYKLGIDYVLVR